jgi:hypothetical protein
MVFAWGDPLVVVPCLDEFGVVERVYLVGAAGFEPATSCV